MADTTNPSKPAAAATPIHETRAISRRDDTIEYERPATRRAGWRDRLNEGLKTFLWIAPLTALIWIYAERAQITSLEVRVPIRVTSTSSDRVVTVLAPTERWVTLELRAPRASLDAIRERLSSNSRPIEVTISDDIPAGFEGDISVTDRIERNPIFQEWAVDVERSFPTVRIKVEKKVSRELKVEQRPEDGGFASVKFTPPTIKVEGPQSYIERIPPDQVAYADLDRLRDFKPGTHHAMVSIIGFAEETVSKSPPKVSATVEIREGEKLNLPTVFIEAIVPVVLLTGETPGGQRTLSVSPRNLTNVEVVGPPAQIDRLRQRQDGPSEFQPKVRVVIDANDVLQPQFVKRVTAEHYILPDDVRVVSANRDITFTVTPR